MGFPPLLNLSTRLSTAALPGQTTKMAQTLESMFQNVAYRPTVYRTGGAGIFHKFHIPYIGSRIFIEHTRDNCIFSKEAIYTDQARLRGGLCMAMYNRK